MDLGALDCSGDDDEVVVELAHTVALLPDVGDLQLDDVALAEGVGGVGPDGLPDGDGPAGTACLALEHECPSVLDHLGVGQSALGADDVRLRVHLDLVVDLVGADLGLEHGPASLDVTRGAQLLEEELENVGIYQNTIRLSIGTEHIDDIIADLEQAFQRVKEV